jgi:hypothetical protein
MPLFLLFTTHRLFDQAHCAHSQTRMTNNRPLNLVQVSRYLKQNSAHPNAQSFPRLDPSPSPDPKAPQDLAPNRSTHSNRTIAQNTRFNYLSPKFTRKCASDRRMPPSPSVTIGYLPPASTPSWPAAGLGASKPRCRVFNTPRKTGGVTLLKLPRRSRRSLGIKRDPQTTTANRNAPAAAEFCTKVTCFNCE